MILFKEDWKKYPNAIIHYETRNESFVRLSSLYRSIGIENHAFLLALVNPELRHVNPHDPNLTESQMKAIAVECKVNPWYFFREVVRVPPLAGSDPVMLEANRGNIALFWCFFNHIMTFLIQIRQTGKSLSTDVLMNLLLNVICRDTEINLLTKDETLRKTNIQRIKDIAEELPKYLQQRTREDSNNTEEITIKRLGNRYKAHVPQSSPKNALKIGRGLTSPIFHCDEGPFQPNISISLPAALAAMGAAGDRARETGSPYGVIMTTTAGKKDDKDGAFVYELLEGSAIWTEKFFDCVNEDELRRIVCAAGRAGEYRVNITMNHRQLGKTDEWLKQKLSESLQSGDDANRDYFNMWTSGNLHHPLRPGLLGAIRESEREPEYIEIDPKYGYITRWYIPKDQIATRMARSKTVMGMDTSEAGGGDDISKLIIDVETLEVLAAGTYNETNMILFSQWVGEHFIKYPNLTGIIERRSTGAMLLDYLLLVLPPMGVDPFKRLFNRIVNEPDDFRREYEEVRQPLNRRNEDIYTKYKKHFGFATSGSGLTSRSGLYSTTLNNAANNSAMVIRDKSLIDQIVGLTTKNGRVDHATDGHDDLVIGWLLAIWFLTQSRNLSFYGIESRSVMCRAMSGEKPLTRGEQAESRKQTELRHHMELVLEELSKEQDEYVSAALEHQLRVLNSQIVVDSADATTLDEMIRKIQESKRSNRRTRQFHSAETAYQNYDYRGPELLISNRPMTASDFTMYA